MGVLRWLALALGGLLVLLAAVIVAARFSDGPLGPFPGGPFESGKPVESARPDWSFLTDVEEVELQLLDPPRSRTTWILVHEGSPFVPAGFLQVPFWKQWPHEAATDGRALLRVEGRIYPVRAEKVSDPELYAALAQRAAQKYGLGDAAPDPDSTWFFRLEPR